MRIKKPKFGGGGKVAAPKRIKMSGGKGGGMKVAAPKVSFGKKGVGFKIPTAGGGGARRSKKPGIEM